MLRGSVFLVILSLLTSWGCSANSPEKKTVTVSILPQKYFITRIAGDKFNVNVMIPPGHSPATYEVTAKQLKQIELSSIYFKIGYIPFEKANMARLMAANKMMKVVDVSDGVNLIADATHNHGDKNNQRHFNVDPHIWLSPAQVKIICQNILNALIEVNGENKSIYEANYQNFISEIDNLDKSIRKSLSPYEGKSFLIFHPSWAYFARDYNIIQVPIEFEGKSPSPAWMKKIVDHAKRERIKVIFIQKQFSSNIASGIAKDIIGKVYQIDPLKENWIECMIESVGLFKKAFKEGYGE